MDCYLRFGAPPPFKICAMLHSHPISAGKFGEALTWAMSPYVLQRVTLSDSLGYFPAFLYPGPRSEPLSCPRQSLSVSQLGVLSRGYHH